MICQSVRLQTGALEWIHGDIIALTYMNKVSEDWGSADFSPLSYPQPMNHIKILPRLLAALLFLYVLLGGPLRNTVYCTRIRNLHLHDMVRQGHGIASHYE